MPASYVSQVAAGVAVQRQIEARAASGVAVCPNDCGLPYDATLGHLGGRYSVTEDEERCVAALGVAG